MLIRLYRRLAGQPGCEECFYFDFEGRPTPREGLIIRDLVREPFGKVTSLPRFRGKVIEVGPRLSVETSFSSNAVASCRAARVNVRRVETSIRYPASRQDLVAIDEMTQEIYPEPLTSFGTNRLPEPVQFIRILEEGRQALVAANLALGLALDDEQIDYYVAKFIHRGSNPTDVELSQIGNGDSEHSRHHFFKGELVIDGERMPDSLMTIVQAPFKAHPGHTLVAFTDNGGVIRGHTVPTLRPAEPWKSSAFFIEPVLTHYTITAETHNHPTLFAPFPGAETGAGGRIRDSRAVGRGAMQHAGVAGYAVGNLHIPGYEIPGERVGGETDLSHASPLEILMRGSDGISDYGNKIGEPLIQGFTRSFGQMVGGTRYEFGKPVLYTGGVSRLDGRHLKKHEPQKGMLIVRIGGPAYRIGVGGGSASSMAHGTNSRELNLQSVQRGDAEMENRANRVIQTCAEMGDKNPIESIHDQGAGGPSNVIPELTDPAGGRIDIRKIVLGDQTMSVREIWVAEFQEGYGLLVLPENLEVFKAICERERVNCEVLGEVTDDGNIVVQDSFDNTTPVNLALVDILSHVATKTYRFERIPLDLPPFLTPNGYKAGELVERVFALLEVGSKRFLTTKVDRSVTGLIAQQQLVGSKQIPVSDVAVTADGYFGLTGVAQAIGEDPIKMLVDPAAGARMSVAEMLTNMAGALITGLPDISGRANWMWPAKLPGEGPRMYDAAVAMRDIMIQLGISVNGGKDSLSMATQVGKERVVSPGELVIFGYAPVRDITKAVTPDFKGTGLVFLIDLGQGKDRLGGSSLSQSFGQLGNESPDIDDVDLLKRSFEAVQELIRQGLITAYHDRSAGGLITTLAEMCMAGNCGASIRLGDGVDPIPFLFNEEAGMVLEIPQSKYEEAIQALENFDVMPIFLGATDNEKSELQVYTATETLLKEKLTTLRAWWEATSTALELLQANPAMVAQEVASFTEERTMQYHLPFIPQPMILSSGNPRPKVAVIREEGTNGDREMTAACFAAGLDPHDVFMRDILSGEVNSLERFQMIIFPGGFSYADVFGSAKGWALTIRHNPRVRKMFDRFYRRSNTLVLGVCNGCQLMAQIGRVSYGYAPKSQQPFFVHNTSGRFESRWSAVKVLPSPSIFMQGMEGSVLGIHVAHGEGRMLLRDPRLMEQITRMQLAPLAFVGVDGEPTEAYPYNPNGSPNGWTALCSPDGRHLAVMPHPERCFLPWQWPWMPEEWRATMKVSPWLQMFHNARTWCLEHQ